MPLQSNWFRGNVRLQKCLVSDPSHVQKGDRGEHVTLIQGALMVLDKAPISNDEQASASYGQSTAKAVLDYKKKRKIINFSYQQSADDIVGRMTIQALDTEVLALELARSRVQFGIAPTLARRKIAIISQNHPLPAKWAQQMEQVHRPNIERFPSRPSFTAEDNVKNIKDAISAVKGGLIIFSVGHGIFQQGFVNQGGFDAAENKKLRLGGLGSFSDIATFVDVFYDDKPPQGSTQFKTEKERDETLKPLGFERRLKNFRIYQDLCKAFVDGKVGGVLLLTCNVGNATGFLKKVATQWQTPIIGYNEFTTYQGGFPGGRVRSIFTSDEGRQNSKNPGSNIPFAEIMFPLSLTKMVQVTP